MEIDFLSHVNQDNVCCQHGIWEITIKKLMNPLLSHQYYKNKCFKCIDQLNVLINNEFSFAKICRAVAGRYWWLLNQLQFKNRAEIIQHPTQLYQAVASVRSFWQANHRCVQRGPWSADTSLLIKVDWWEKPRGRSSNASPPLNSLSVLYISDCVTCMFSNNHFTKDTMD